MGVMIAFIFNILFNFAIGLLVAKFLGPEEYGRFALALATAMAVQTAFFDWLRLGATRFYSERMRSEDPSLRATLDLGFAVITVGLAVGASALLLTGVTFPLSTELIGLALGASVANGLFDYSSALVRARFHNGLYIRLVIVKNLLSLALVGGGAFWFGSATMTLIGGIISLSGTVVTARAALHDPGADLHGAQASVARTLATYALPIVGANLLYLIIPLANRSLIAVLYGFSETGQFSLAYDIGTKAVQAIGSTLDVFLFQIAVATHERLGADRGRVQIAQNMAIVIAILLPACTGIWLTLPSIEHLIVPVQYRGPFGELLPLMMTGLFCSGLIQYGINPIFQIRKQTAPLIAAAAVACVVDPALVFLLPRSTDASSLAIAQAGAFAAALVALIGFACASKPKWPSLGDLAKTALGTAAMAAVLLPLRDWEPGFATLTLQIGAGALIYGLIVFAFNIAGLRELVFPYVGTLVQKLRASKLFAP
jgi:O-antigen/teichoic acid export membrane protein